MPRRPCGCPVLDNVKFQNQLYSVHVVSQNPQGLKPADSGAFTKGGGSQEELHECLAEGS